VLNGNLQTVLEIESINYKSETLLFSLNIQHWDTMTKISTTVMLASENVVRVMTDIRALLTVCRIDLYG